MRDSVKQAVVKFISGDLPRDSKFFQQRRQRVSQLVKSIKNTGYYIAWEPPIDMFNFYHLQIPVDKTLEVPLYEITIDLVEKLFNEDRATSFLHLLVSNFSCFTFAYWTRFLPHDFQESISIEQSFQDLKEAELFELVQQNIENQGWVLLSSSEANEPVPDAYSPWPNREEAALVKHILFPGCSPLCDS